MTAAGTIPPAKVLVLGAGVAGPAGARDRAAPGRADDGLRRAARGRRAGRSRSARKWLDLGIEAAGEGGYARELTDGGARPAAAGADRRDQGLRRRHHDRARARAPGAEARHRRGGRGHEAGQRDRRPGRRGGRQLRADRAGRGRGQARRDDRLAAEPAGARCPSTPAQLYARNVAGAARADRSTTTGDAGASTSTTRSSPARASRATARSSTRARRPRPAQPPDDACSSPTSRSSCSPASSASPSSRRCPNTLHTPLMSGTNAIHGIVVLGGIIVLGLGRRRLRSTRSCS